MPVAARATIIRRAYFECLEARQLLAVVPPTNLAAIIERFQLPDLLTNRLKLTFTDTNSAATGGNETGYEVQRIGNGLSTWEFAGTVPAAAGSGSTLTYNEVLPA